MFTAEEICKLVVERIGTLLKNPNPGLVDDIYNLSDDRIDDEPIDDADAEEININYEDFLEWLEPDTEFDIDNVLGELFEVEYGCKIHIQKTPGGAFFISKLPMKGEQLNYLQRKCLGKSIGYKLKIDNSIYEIVDIKR